MKQRVVITAEELKDAALYLLTTKPQFFGKHVATVEFVFDVTDVNPARRIRIEAVIFDTAEGAKRYLATGEVMEETTGEKAAPAVDQPAADNLEGVRNG